MARRMLTIARPTVLLPQPDSPDQAQRFALFEREADAVHRLHFRRSSARRRLQRRESSRADSRFRESSWIHQMAAHPMSRRCLDELRLDQGASSRAARCSASRICIRRADRECWARCRESPGAARACRHPPPASEASRPRVYGCSGFLEQLLHRRHFLNFAAVHDDHAMASLRHHGEIVRDQQNGRVLPLVLDAQHEFENLRLDGDVQRGGRLVGDQHAKDCTPAPWRSSRAAACRRKTAADSRSCARPGRESRPAPASRRIARRLPFSKRARAPAPPPSSACRW